MGKVGTALQRQTPDKGRRGGGGGCQQTWERRCIRREETEKAGRKLEGKERGDQERASRG